MWVKLLRDRDFTPPDNRRITVAYKEGMQLPIKRAWGELLIADGDAEEIDTPNRTDDARDADGDGHDDKTGRFVEKNTAARRRAPEETKG